MIANKVKKGDFVALSATASTTYAIGSGRGTERRTYWTIAKVNTASRDGEVRTIERRGRGIDKVDPRAVMTLSGKAQTAAAKLWAKLTWDTDEYESQDALKAAIRAEMEA